MARPIEPTPSLKGEDARRLLASLETGASDAEMRRREDAARAYMARLDSPEGLIVTVPSK